jgi:hypothetical protein
MSLAIMMTFCRRFLLSGLFSILVAGADVRPALAQEASRSTASKPAIPVALYDDGGVGGKGPKMLEEKLNSGPEFHLTRLKAEDIRAGRLKDFKILIVPGGSGKKEADTLGSAGREKVKQFVADGGTYVGICAGCYLASCHYWYSLHILPVTVVDAPNWERGKADLKLKLTSDGKEWLARSENEVTTLYHNGPVLAPIPDADQKLIPLATYGTEITRKGAQPNLMVNTPAIAAARFQKGWAIGVSPHPEQTEGLTDFVPAILNWAQTHPLEK